MRMHGMKIPRDWHLEEQYILPGLSGYPAGLVHSRFLHWCDSPMLMEFFRNGDNVFVLNFLLSFLTTFLHSLVIPPSFGPRIGGVCIVVDDRMIKEICGVWVKASYNIKVN